VELSERLFKALSRGDPDGLREKAWMMWVEAEPYEKRCWEDLRGGGAKGDFITFEQWSKDCVSVAESIPQLARRVAKAEMHAEPGMKADLAMLHQRTFNLADVDRDDRVNAEEWITFNLKAIMTVAAAERVLFY